MKTPLRNQMNRQAALAEYISVAEPLSLYDMDEQGTVRGNNMRFNTRVSKQTGC